ncbi:MAG: PDZ domain-containing protein [Deltaproteobacteria bacterium]|nr:PDZ domain-containing protein [Deltaproteobacteria bacterium]
MTSFHMGGARLDGKREKCSDSALPKATMTRGNSAGRFHRLTGTIHRFPWLLALVSLVSIACSSPLPGTIGAQLGKRTDGRVFVRGVPVGQGAEKAGLQVDDEVIAIEGKSVREMTQDDIKRAVRGDLGTTFTVTIERNGRRQDVKIERSPLLPAGQENKK